MLEWKARQIGPKAGLTLKWGRARAYQISPEAGLQGGVGLWERASGPEAGLRGRPRGWPTVVLTCACMHIPRRSCRQIQRRGYG